MSELSEVMSRQVFLEVCMGIESICADLYHYYSEIYQDVPEASLLWKKTALEEENHQKQFGLALRMINETDFEVVKDSLDRAHSIQFKLLKLVNQIKTVKPDLKMAVSKAVEMEGKLADLHAYTSIQFKEESMQKLFKALSEADSEHMSDLQQYLTILQLPQSKMAG